MINDIFDPDKVGTVSSHSEIRFISPHEISFFISLGNISISHTFM